eukprot:9032045-Alexandrium_andersonii.AAC.1
MAFAQRGLADCTQSANCAAGARDDCGLRIGGMAEWRIGGLRWRIDGRIARIADIGGLADG